MLSYFKSFIYEKFTLSDSSCINHYVDIPIVKYDTKTVDKQRLVQYTYYSAGRLLTGHRYEGYKDTVNVPRSTGESIKVKLYIIKDDSGRWCYSFQDDIPVKTGTKVTSVLCSYLTFETDECRYYNILGFLSLSTKILVPSAGLIAYFYNK